MSPFLLRLNLGKPTVSAAMTPASLSTLVVRLGTPAGRPTRRSPRSNGVSSPPLPLGIFSPIYYLHFWSRLTAVRRTSGQGASDHTTILPRFAPLPRRKAPSGKLGDRQVTGSLTTTETTTVVSALSFGRNAGDISFLRLTGRSSPNECRLAQTARISTIDLSKRDGLA
jgi:hypothetical protein